jgi:RecB family exonuclease
MSSKPETIFNTLTVYPTAVALRQAQRRALERDAFFDGRGHVTLSSLLRECAGLALKKSGLRPISDLDRELAIVEAVGLFRSTKGGKGRILGALAPAALEETLSQLIESVAPLADRADEFLKLLAADRAIPKNPELAALHAAYTGVCRSLGVADEATLNTAILTLLRGDRSQWPPLLGQAQTIAFVAIRWVAPFQESVIQALASRLGRDNVIVRHILTDYEQDWWGGTLLTNTGRLLFGDAQAMAGDCEFQAESTRAAIEHLTSLREGYAMQDRALAEQARSRVGFSCSVGIYGEIEDLARRIAWELHDRPDPLRPEDICLVTRNLGAASDAIMDVFARFNIPYYFRRGVPVLSVPIIKTLVDFARFSATRDRDIFCALLHSPWVSWQESGIDPTQLADDLLRSGVEPILDDPARISKRLSTYALEQRRFATRAEADDYASSSVKALRLALGSTKIESFDAGLADLESRCATCIHKVVHDVEPGDNLAQRTQLLNDKAWETVSEMLTTLRRHSLVNKDTSQSISWDDIVDVLNRALENLTVSPSPPDENGVWILNPFDIAGLSFKVVLLAGLNAGAFPKSPVQSPLFPDSELLGFQERLMKKGPLPVAALAASKARNSQENLLFLTTLAASRDQMVFSYAGHDETGQELTPSVFFSTLWRLVGWPAWPTLPAEPPDPYDAWRLSKGSAHLQTHWSRHLEIKKTQTSSITPFKRRPFPGESYLGTVPLALCRADDERRQRVAAGSLRRQGYGGQGGPEAVGLAEHISHGIRVERQRQAFFARQNQEDQGIPADHSKEPGHEFAGVLDTALWTRIRPTPANGIIDFSPTQLERLVACPYQYYLQYVLRVEAIEPNDLEPSTMDFGTAIHAILCEGFKLLQGNRPNPSIPGLAKLAKAHQRLVTPAWAVRDQQGRWHLQETDGTPSTDALPLVNFPSDTKALIAFFDALTGTLLDWATSGNAIWMLGAPEQLNVQRRRISRAVRNLVRTAFDPEALPELPDLEGGRRFPALLEYTFNDKFRSAAASLELADPANPEHKLRLHGKIDRVDLVFGADGLLRAVVVVDYKGSSKATLKTADLAEGISTAADCQLPAYALAAGRAFGPYEISDFRSDIPILMQYLSYTLPQEKMVKQCQANWIGLDGRPGKETDLVAAFTASAFAALNRYERGDFAVAPQACDYCTLNACCRHAASLLSTELPEGRADS